MPPAMKPTEATLRAWILDAFGGVGIPRAEELLLDVFTDNDDAYEMAEAFRGRHWTELRIRELYYHRQMLFALSRTGFRAYLPAYLAAALANDRQYGPDIQEFLVLGLHAISKRDLVAKAGHERLSHLDTKQHAVTVGVLMYLERRMGRWYSREIQDIIRSVARERPAVL